MLAGCVEDQTVEAPEKTEATVVEPVAKVEPAPTPVEVKKVEPVVEVKGVEPAKEEHAGHDEHSAVADKVVVTVDGQKIMLSTIDERIAPQLENMKKMGREPTPEMLDSFRVRVIGGVIRETLVEAKFKANTIVVSDADVTAKLEDIAKQQGTTVEQLIASAAPQGYTEEKIREQIKMGLSFEKLMDIEAGADVLAVTDEDAKKFFEDNAQRFSSPNLVKTSHILAGKRGFDSATEEEKAAAKLKIEEVKKKLDAGGNFEELAKEYSDCPSKDKGGDLGVYISVDGRVGGMDPTFSAAAHKVAVGEVTDIVKTPFGYHLIKVTDKKPAKVTSFEEAKADIIAQQVQIKKNQFASGYISSLMEGAKVVYAEGYEPKPAPMPMPQMRPAPEPAPK